MLPEELKKKENWLDFSDEVLNLSVINTTLGRWNGTFSKNALILFYVVNNDYHKVLHINHYIRLQDIIFLYPFRHKTTRKNWQTQVQLDVGIR